MVRNHAVLSAIIAILLVSATASFAAVVTVDTAGQSATSDDTNLEARWVKPRSGQFAVIIQNTTLAPRDVTIKFTGLPGASYDVYVNNDYIGAKSAKDLETGLPHTVDGTIADPDMMRCLKATKPIVDAAYARVSKSKDSEPARVAATLGQAAEWVRSGIRSEQTFRSVHVMLVPAGKVLEQMSHPTRLDDIGTARAITRACWLLQQARARMSTVINDPDLRNEAVAAMTPVDLAATCSVGKGLAHLEAKLTNNCNLPISGTITPAIPKGWRSKTKSAKFADLKCGRTFKAVFDIVAATNPATITDGIKLAAAVKIVQDQFEAKYQIRTTVHLSAPAQTPAKPGVSTGLRKSR